MKKYINRLDKLSKWISEETGLEDEVVKDLYSEFLVFLEDVFTSDEVYHVEGLGYFYGKYSKSRRQKLNGHWNYTREHYSPRFLSEKTYEIRPTRRREIRTKKPLVFLTNYDDAIVERWCEGLSKCVLSHTTLEAALFFPGFGEFSLRKTGLKLRVAQPMNFRIKERALRKLR